MSHKIQTWIEGHFGVMMALGFVLGLLSPWAASLPDILIFVILGGMVFFSSSRITMDELSHLHPGHALSFYGARFLALPFILYFACQAVLPNYAEAIFLLALAPAGASAAAVTGLMRGNTTLALGYVVVSHLLIPLTLPLALHLVGYDAQEIDLWGLFYTTAAVILIPIALYFGLARRVEKVKLWTRGKASIGSILLITALVFVIVAKQRDQILGDPAFLIEALPILGLFFILFYVFGWLFPAAGKTGDRVAHSVCSGAMNSGIVIGLAFSYFSPMTTLLLVLTEFWWVVSPPAFKAFLNWRESRG